MGKKKGKKKGKSGKARSSTKATPTTAGDQDAAVAAVEAEDNVTRDAPSSADASASGPILADGAADEDVSQQEAEGLNNVGENEPLVDEANTDEKINAEASGASDKTQDVSTPEPSRKEEKSDDDVSTVVANNESEQEQESSVTNLPDTKMSADERVPTKQEREEVGIDAVPLPGLPLINSAGTEPDIEPTLTTSFGSNSIGDEFDTNRNTGAIGNAPVVSSDQQGRQAQYQSASKNNHSATTGSRFSDTESEAASPVMSDFTIGNFSTISADSAIVALASVTRDEAVAASAATAQEGDGARNSTISPLPTVARGLSSEETKALPPLDTSVDYSPEVSLAGDDGDREVSAAGGATQITETNSEDAVSDEAEEELDREIGTSLLAVAGQPSPRHAAVSPAESTDSTNVEIGSNSEGQVDIVSDGSDKDNEKDSTNNKSFLATAAAAGLTTAGVAAGAVAIANSEDTVYPASLQDTVSDSPSVDHAKDVAPGCIENANEEKGGEDTTPEESQAAIEGVTASDNDAENKPPSDTTGVEGELGTGDSGGDGEDNPSAYFTSNEASQEESRKEQTSSAVALSAPVAGAAVMGAAAIGGDVPSAEGKTTNDDSETLVGAVDGDTNADGAVVTSKEAAMDTADEATGEAATVQKSGDDECVEANDNGGKGVVAAAVAGAAVVGAVAAGVAATGPNAPPSVAVQAENEESGDGELSTGVMTSPESSTRVEEAQIDEEKQQDSKGIAAAAIGATATAAGVAVAGLSAGAADADAPTSEAVPSSTPCESDTFDEAAIDISGTASNRSVEEESFNDSLEPGRHPSKDSSEGEFYQHGTFSEEDDSSEGSRASSKNERETGFIAAAAIGVVTGVAVAGAVAPVGSASADDVTAATVTPEDQDFGNAKSSEDDTTCIDVTPVATEDSQQKDLEAVDEYHKHRQSKVAQTFAAGSANANGPGKSKRDKKKCMLIAAGAMVLIGGIVGLVLALTLGRQDSKGAPVLPDETLRPTALPTPEDVSNPSIPVLVPTAAPIGEGTSAPTKGSIDDTSQPTDILLVTSQPTSLTTGSSPTFSPTLVPGAPTSAPVVTTAAPTLVPTEQRPTPSPTTLAFAETFEDLQDYLVDFVPNPAALQDPSSPQYAAVSWLASDLAEKGVNRRLQEQLEVIEAVVVQQRYALATLYFATDGDNWSDPSYIEGDPWLSASNVCSWKGVICSPLVTPRVRSTTPYQGAAVPHRANPSLRGRRLQEEEGPDEDSQGISDVMEEEEDIAASTTTSPGPTPASIVSPQEPQLLVTGLELEERNLSGPLPPDIVILSGLKYFAASDNAITGIPSEIRGLKGLERLYFDNNAIEGQLPTSLARLPNLIDLSLDGNKMTGTIPPSLGNLASLDSLTLHNNDLTGDMPEFVCVLRYNGEDDVLDHLTADCASSGDAPPMVECDCCTECYPLTTLSDVTAAPSTLTPSLSPTVTTVDLSASPTISPTAEDSTSASPTISEERPTASDPPTVPGGDVVDDIVAVAPEADGEAPATTDMTAEGPKEGNDESLESTTAPTADIMVTPTQAPMEITAEDGGGANDEVQDGRDRRDSNDWYLLIYGDPNEEKVGAENNGGK